MYYKTICEIRRHTALFNFVKLSCIYTSRWRPYFSVSEPVQIHSLSTDVDGLFYRVIKHRISHTVLLTVVLTSELNSEGYGTVPTDVVPPEITDTASL